MRVGGNGVVKMMRYLGGWVYLCGIGRGKVESAVICRRGQDRIEQNMKCLNLLKYKRERKFEISSFILDVGFWLIRGFVIVRGRVFVVRIFCGVDFFGCGLRFCCVRCRGFFFEIFCLGGQVEFFLKVLAVDFNDGVFFRRVFFCVYEGFMLVGVFFMRVFWGW